MRHPILALAVSLALVAWCRGDVVISEIQPSNGSTLLDEDGDASDWVELYNRGAATVDLSGWGLSDRTDDPFKWTFPTVQIGAGQRMVVWCSGKDRIGGAAIAADSPDDIPGLVLWLKAEGQNYTDGQTAPTWTDLSGRGNHGTAPFSGARPVFKANRINGKPAFQFTRAQSQEFRLPVTGFNGLTNLNNHSMFAVAKWSGSGVPSGIFGAWNSSNPATDSHLEVGTLGAVSFRTAAMDHLEAEAAAGDDEWVVLSATLAGTQDSPLARLYKNGQLAGTRGQGPGPVPLSGMERMTIGCSQGTGHHFSGDIAEVLIYDRALTAMELAFLDVHLGLRYGLPGSVLPAGQKIHTSFSIDSAGEPLVLTRPGGTTEDLVAPASVPQDASYGRSPESGSTWKWFASPTPGQPNAATSYGPPLAKPVLSAPRGFKTSTFSLAITHPDAGATIRYTLDGSEPTLTNGSTYSSPVSINKTRVVRAAAFKTGTLPTRAIATNTYLFLNDIVTQTSRPSGYPATWGEFAETSYSISPTIAGQSGYTNTMKAALAGLPTLSISLAPDDMFGDEGVYTDSLEHGLEKAVSAEWLTADNSFDTQIDAGLRVHGGASRYHTKSPKKSFRLAFRGQYGEGRLRVPIFSDAGTPLADFNGLILRANFNNSWVSLTSSERDRAIIFRDQWMRDTQIAMNGRGSHGNLVHLYINGLYWGIYNPSERPDAEFAASYSGGEPEDYDAMNHDGVVDGDNVAWNAMRDLARAGVTTPAAYAAIQQYLDVDQYIDYMLLNFYGSNQDWPDNNWTATRRREPGAGYRFFVWDAEMTMHSATSNRTNPPNSDLAANDNPGMLYTALRQNPEFRLRFADRAHRYLFNGGALTPTVLAQRFTDAAAKTQPGVFAEQARWGAYRKEIFDLDGPSPIYTLDPHWLAARDWLLGSYFPVRTANLLVQLKNSSLYPGVDAPSFSPFGGQLANGQTVSLGAPAGVIHYTLDGSDPRVANTGTVSPTATTYSSALAITGQKTLKARVLSGGVWSALAEAEFSTLPAESLFKPAGSANWTTSSNWTPTPYPNGSGKRALINAPTTADRNVSLLAPVTIGSIRFNEAGNAWRNRIRDQNTGNTLTFNGGSGQEAQLRVDGDGTGYVEFENLAGTVLATSLEVQVNHPDGNEEHGALRLRERWSGPGGLRKTGPGVASLTGEDKDFMGPLLIQEGVLQLTEPSTPALASAVSIGSGGQLRLVSGSSPGVPRVYGFAKPIKLAGQGRGAAIPDDAGHGKLGALRYDPGNGENHAIVPVAIELTAAAGIHVDGPLNRLELPVPLTPSGFPLTKSGGGVLHLKAGNANFTSPVIVSNGTLELSGPLGSAVELAATGMLTGHGGTGPLSGDGTVELGGKILTAPTLSGTVVSAAFTNAGPLYQQPSAAGNGLLAVDAIAAPPAGCRIYLPGTGNRFRGLIFAPWEVDLAAALHASDCEVYRPDGSGGWLPAANAQVVTMPETADFGSGPVLGRIVEVRLDAPPVSFEAWQALHFPSFADQSNPAISGPDANPRRDGVPNLLRYALGIGPGDSPRDALPRFERHNGRGEFRFPFDPGRDDIACVVEMSSRLDDWANADVIFDSRTDLPGELADGWITVTDPGLASRRFYRLRVVLR